MKQCESVGCINKIEDDDHICSECSDEADNFYHGAYIDED